MNELGAGAFFTALAVASVRKYPRQTWVYATELSVVTALMGAACALQWWTVPIRAPLWLHTVSFVACAAAGISCALIVAKPLREAPAPVRRRQAIEETGK